MSAEMQIGRPLVPVPGVPVPGVPLPNAAYLPPQYAEPININDRNPGEGERDHFENTTFLDHACCILAAVLCCFWTVFD